MTTRGVFRQALEKRRAEKLRALRPQIATVAQAMPLVENLTASEHWNVFLQVVQGRIEELRADGQKLRSMNPALAPDLLVEHHARIRSTDAAREALEWVAGLPAELMEKGKLAAQLLQRIDS